MVLGGDTIRDSQPDEIEGHAGNIINKKNGINWRKLAWKNGQWSLLKILQLDEDPLHMNPINMIRAAIQKLFAQSSSEYILNYKIAYELLEII